MYKIRNWANSIKTSRWCQQTIFENLTCLNRYTCPGFYRCRSSPVCVHLSDLCDGWPQCPQSDDEWLCDSTCPHHLCRCQGQAFVCRTSFPAHQYPQLRYLDASWSGMTLHNLSPNVHLIRLHLRWCNLTALTAMDFSNMRTLDIRHNNLTVVNLDNLLALTNLRNVQFAYNPLVSTTAGDNKLRQDHLSEVDISNTRLVTLNTTAFFKYIGLKVGALKDAFIIFF